MTRIGLKIAVFHITARPTKTQLCVKSHRPTVSKNSFFQNFAFLSRCYHICMHQIIIENKELAVPILV